MKILKQPLIGYQIWKISSNDSFHFLCYQYKNVKCKNHKNKILYILVTQQQPYQKILITENFQFLNSNLEKIQFNDKEILNYVYSLIRP